MLKAFSQAMYVKCFVIGIKTTKYVVVIVIIIITQKEEKHLD